MFLYIDLAGQDTLTLKFQLLDSPFAHIWIERMNSRGNYPLDHPDRFYGFNSQEEEIKRAEQYIQSCIDTINHFRPIIKRSFTHYQDQDCLNYLHNIFERYHGLLDQQSHDFWNQATHEVRQALAELNLAVHRCETVNRGTRPRFVCTWYGMPKTLHLPLEHMLKYGTLGSTFGTVYLNYAEIGKTLEDLANDRDNYIGDDAFKPYDYYSADFVVKFWDETDAQIQSKIELMEEYYNTHQDFFATRGYTKFNDPRLLPLRWPVAQLVETMPRGQLLKEIQQRQYVAKVYIE
jgi:hypothetical protein